MQTSCDSQRNEQKSKALRQQKKTAEKLSQLAATDSARDHVREELDEHNNPSTFNHQESLNLHNNANVDNDFLDDASESFSSTVVFTHNKKEELGSDEFPFSQISEQEMKNILRGLTTPIKMDKNKSLEQNLLQITDETLRSVVKTRLLNEDLLREIEKRFDSAIGFVCNFSKQKKKHNNDDDEEKHQRHTLYHANSISGDDDTRTVFFIRPEYNTSKFEIVGIGQHTDKSRSEASKAYYDMSHYFFPKCGFLEENPRVTVRIASGLGLTKM